MQSIEEEKLAKAKKYEDDLGVDAYDDIMLMTDEEFRDAYKGASNEIFGNDNYFYENNIAVNEEDLRLMAPKSLEYVNYIVSFMQSGQINDAPFENIMMQRGLLDGLLVQSRKLIAKLNKELEMDLESYDAIKEWYLKSEFMKEEIYPIRILISKAINLNSALKEVMSRLDALVEDEKYDR